MKANAPYTSVAFLDRHFFTARHQSSSLRYDTHLLMPRTRSLPRIAITATGNTVAELVVAARQALLLTKFVELRLDWVAEPREAIREVATLLRDPLLKKPPL